MALARFRTTSARTYDAKTQASAVIYFEVTKLEINDEFYTITGWYYYLNNGNQEYLGDFKKSFTIAAAQNTYNNTTFTETTETGKNRELVELNFPTLVVNNSDYGIGNVNQIELVAQ